ncbi:MAG: 5'-nucleotidase, lipoprotein e(P4) family [Cyclobacteriaceae bacterium]
MKVNNLASIIVVLSFLFSSCGSTRTSVSESHEKALAEQGMGATLWFQTSAEMQAAYYQAYRYGRLLLEKKLELNSYDNPAVVFDIDETLLDNSPYQAWLIDNGELYGSDSWKDWTDKVRASALPGALEFTAYVRSKGIDIYYISNRRESAKEATMKNLEKLGFPQVEDSHVLLRTGPSDKTERRERVMETHDVILYVGDNLTDFSQLFDARGTDFGRSIVDRYRDELLNNFVILPNPMYGEWERAILGNETGLSPAQQDEQRRKALER